LARDETTIKLQAKLDDRNVYKRIGRELARYDRRVAKLLDDFGDDAVRIFQFHALKKTGRMARGIRAIKTGDGQLRIEVEAVDPESGFDYVRVTRFGHVVGRIYPGRIARSIYSEAQYTKAGGFRTRPLKGARALKTPWGPKSSVRGFRPASDWAEPAYDEVRILAQEKLEEMGEDIVDSIGRGT